MIDAGRRAPLKAVRLQPHAITAISTSSARKFCANFFSTAPEHLFGCIRAAGCRLMLCELSRTGNAKIREARVLVGGVKQ